VIFNLSKKYDYYTFIYLENSIDTPYMSKFKLHYKKHSSIEISLLGKQYNELNEEDATYNPYSIHNLQHYQPLYKVFFEMNQKNSEILSFNHKYHMVGLNQVQENEGKTMDKPIFNKFSPLLDPYRYMIGKYDIDDPRNTTLPSLESTLEQCNQKLLSYHNASYIDGFFCFLTSIVLNHHHIKHGLDYYGSYLGIQEKFRVNIADDLEYLRNSSFFNEQIGKLFYIEDRENSSSFQLFPVLGNSRKNKQKLDIGNEELNIECDDLSLIVDDNEYVQESTDLETIYSKSSKNSSISSMSSDSNSELNYSSEEEESIHSEDSQESEDSEDSEESEESEDEELFAYIHNFPIQMISMEKCHGTLDDLFADDKVDEKSGASILFQIVMILLIYQKMYSFTHNDLHTNNIMYIETDEEFLHYTYDNKHYKVPTYGKIFKIIDFGRAIFKFQGKTFCSDSFAKDGDAVTQYNCEPFMNSKRPRLEPNNSFDLCRLGSSLFDFVMDIDDKEEELDELQKTIKRWCLDDNGKNILYKRNGEERYPSFKLYKMIARSVHNHTPEKQLDYDYFKQYMVDEMVESCVNIDMLPCYINK